MPIDSKKNAMADIDEASERVDALCELLAAAEEKKVSAACVHSMLHPIALQLGRAAGVIADSSEKPACQTPS